MPVPSSIADLASTAGSNYPAGSESPSTADDYFRAHASFIAQLRAVVGGAANPDIPSAAADLEADLLNSADSAKGGALVGFARSQLASIVSSAANALNGHSISVWEFASLITVKPDPADPRTWDWAPAINAAYAAAAAYPVDAGVGLRWSKSVYFPGGLYLVSETVGPTRNGIATHGEGPLTSVIRPMPGFTDPWIWHAQHSDITGNTGGCSISDLGIDCANVATGGCLLSDAYDGVVINNLRVSRVHAAHNGFKIGKRTDGEPGTGVSQTVLVFNLFAYKEGTTASVPTVVVDHVQEAQFIGCKAWAGGYGGSGRSPTSAWEIRDSRSIDLLGCSAAGADDFGVIVRAVTRSVSGIRLRGMLYENCNGRMRSSSFSPTAYPVTELYHDLPRLESPTLGGFDLRATDSSILDVGVSTVILDSECTQNVIMAQRLANVTDNGTNNLIRAQPNALDAFAGMNQPLRVVRPVAPMFSLGRPDTSDYAYLQWNSSSSSDFGLQLGVNKGGVSTAVATFDKDPSANTSAMTLLVNIGGTLSAKAVSLGAVDSGGVGYRALRVLNT